MAAKQNQNKMDKRAAALRDNLRKRKELKKADKKKTKDTAEGTKNGSA